MKNSRRHLTTLSVSMVLAVVAGATALASGPDSVDVTRYTIEQFMGSTSFGGASFSPGGDKLLVSHNGSGIFNTYAMPVDGSEPVQLTHSESDGMFAVTYFRTDERFIYRADQGGNELAHLYVQDPGGEVTDLTPGDGHLAQFAGWSGDGQSFYVATNERDARFFDLYHYRTADGYPREMIFQNDEGFFPGGISDDGRYLTLTQVRTTADNDLFLQDLGTGERTHLTPHTGNVSSGTADFSPDGSALYLTTNEGSEFQYLVRYEIASGERTVVMEPEWDVSGAGFSRSGTYLVVRVNADAQTELQVLDVATGEAIELPPVPDGDITSVSFSGDDSRMAFYLTSSRLPSDLFTVEMDGGEPHRLTRSLHPEIDPDDLVDGRVARFDSYDGLEIPGVLYRPHDASAENKAPALVWVHGGPGGQSRVGYSGFIQYLVNHGYVVYAINNRGSSGYGKTFFTADDQRHGEADLGDVVASKEMLIATGYVDAERIGIIGGSYGGYMVLAALAFAPEEFDVGVDIFGVANWLRTLESIPPWWEAQREALYTELGNPETDRERLTRISPLFHGENIVKPMIVLQGANDPRVLQVESDEMVEAVRANGVPVEYIVFPDEGHGFRNRANQINGYRAVLQFLDKYLKDPGRPITDG